MNLSNLFFLGSIKLLCSKLFTPRLVGDDTLLNLFGGTAQARQERIWKGE
jgi:hypothetical protein